MVKFFLIIVLSVLGTSGGIWGGLQYRKTSAASNNALSKNADTPKLEFLTPELFIVPVLGLNEMKGYLICRLVLAVDANKPAPEGVSEELLLNEYFLEIAFNSNAYIAGQTKVPDLSSVSDTMLERMNNVSGLDRYKGIFIQQIDFFNREDVRNKVVEDRFPNSNSSSTLQE